MGVIPTPLDVGDVVLGRRSMRRSGLLSVATPLPEGLSWQSGVSFREILCADIEVGNGCYAFDTTPEPTASSLREPFWIRASGTCTPMSRLAVAEVARQRLAVMTEFAVGREFVAGTASGNDGLGSLTSLGSFGGAEALGQAEQAAVTAYASDDLVVHATHLAAARLASDGALHLMTDGTLWTTSGLPVAVSPGYPEDEESGESPGNEANLWVTSRVWVGMTDAEVLHDADHRQNNDEAIAQRLAIVVTDLCGAQAAYVAACDCAAVI